MSLAYIPLNDASITFATAFTFSNNFFSYTILGGQLSGSTLVLNKFDGSSILISGFTGVGSISGFTGADIIAALGYTPYNGTTNPNNFLSLSSGDTRYYLKSNPNGYLSSITYSQVITALGFVPSSGGTSLSQNQLITFSGDVYGSGTTAVTLTLNSIITPITVGSSTQIPILQIDDKGRITSATTITVAGGSGSSGITAINSQTNSFQTLVTGSTGIGFNISSNAGVHIFNIPIANSGTTNGLISNTDYNKFNNYIINNSAITSSSAQTWSIDAIKTYISTNPDLNITRGIVESSSGTLNWGAYDIQVLNLTSDLIINNISNISLGKRLLVVSGLSLFSFSSSTIPSINIVGSKVSGQSVNYFTVQCIDVNNPTFIGEWFNQNPTGTSITTLENNLLKVISTWSSLTYGTTVVWNTEQKQFPMAKVTATGNFLLSMTNVRDASEGTLKLITNTTSAITINFDTTFTSKTINTTFSSYTFPIGTAKEYFLYYVADGNILEWTIVDRNGMLLTGDVVSTNMGIATIQTDSVTYAKINSSDKRELLVSSSVVISALTINSGWTNGQKIISGILAGNFYSGLDTSVSPNVRYLYSCVVDGTANRSVVGDTEDIRTSQSVRHGLFETFVDAPNSGITETDLFSFTIPSTKLTTNGQSVEAYFVSSLANTPFTKKQKVIFSANTIFDTGILTTVTSGATEITVKLMRVNSSVIRYSIVTQYLGVTGGTTMSVGELTGLNLAATNILKVTGTAGAGGSTNDIIGKFSKGVFVPVSF